MAATLLVVLVAAIALISPSAKSPSTIREATPQPSTATTRGTLEAPQAAAAPSSAGAATTPGAGPGAEAGAAVPLASSAPGAASTTTRVQQLAASITLGTTAANVQGTSDAVAQLASRDGGYVQSSNVQVQQHGSSEATLSLRLPSAKLSAALAGIGRLAAVRAENQSLQDITNTYDSARQQLSDAVAERRALLRALAAATTEGQIDSLRQRLSESRAAIGRAQSAFNAVSQRASTSEVEVTVLGDVHASSEGLTFHRGIHDAGQVLLVALIALLILLAVAAPLALALFAALSLRRAWRRHQRERVLNGA
jgi:vacuolar-type H+-ATPase subunit H